MLRCRARDMAKFYFATGLAGLSSSAHIIVTLAFVPGFRPDKPLK